VFTHAADPLEADDWLHAVEKQLNIAQCDDRQKVLFASRQLQEKLRTSGNRMSMVVPPMLPQSLGRSLERTSELIIYQKG
jgi:polyhydroxyalkanoate synthesis regulator protein